MAVVTATSPTWNEASTILILLKFILMCSILVLRAMGSTSSVELEQDTFSRTSSHSHPLGQKPAAGPKLLRSKNIFTNIKNVHELPIFIVSRYFIYALEYLASWSWNKREYFVHPSLYQLSLSPLGCQMWVYTQDAKCLKISNAATHRVSHNIVYCNVVCIPFWSHA